MSLLRKFNKKRLYIISKADILKVKLLDSISNYDYEVLILGAIPGEVIDYLNKLPTENKLRYNLSYYIIRYLKSRITRLNKSLFKDYLIGYIIVSTCPRLRLVGPISRVNTNTTVAGRKKRYVIYPIFYLKRWLIYCFINI